MKSLIERMDFSRFRHWILVIESTWPNSSVEFNDKWRAFFPAKLVLAYSDGLNRFYIAKEHPELMDSFCYPPNVFEEFIRYDQNIFEARAQQGEDVLNQALTQLGAVYASASRCITNPLRKLMNFLKSWRCS